MKYKLMNKYEVNITKKYNMFYYSLHKNPYNS